MLRIHFSYVSLLLKADILDFFQSIIFGYSDTFVS